MALVDIKVPDIGDFDEVGVIEVLVAPGDRVRVEQSLITVESDKASMEIPSAQAGVVRELKVQLGDKVKQGSVILTLEVSDAGSDTDPQESQEKPAQSLAGQALTATLRVANCWLWQRPRRAVQGATALARIEKIKQTFDWHGLMRADVRSAS